VLFIVINFIFASNRLTELNVPAKPFIEGGRMTTVAIVFLILNGEMNSTTLQKVANQEFLGFKEKRIGFRVSSTEQPDLIEKWLDPKAEILLCFRNIHFSVVKGTLGKMKLLKWDCQAGGESFCSQPGELNWADK
jgi:hypothetical protein